MQALVYALFRMFIFAIRLTPFRLLYALSDFFSWFVFSVLKYRRGVVRDNIWMCFPDKKEEEVDEIADKFQKHLSDLIVEGLKGISMSESELKKRYKFSNIELLDEYAEKGQHVIIVSGHYGNWEWASLLVEAYTKHKAIAIYKKVNNKYIDRYVRKSRSDRNTQLMPTFMTKDAFQNVPSDPTMYVMLSDQCPLKTKKAHWIEFMGIESGFLHGFEFQAKKYDYPVIYCECKKTKRGHYDARFELMTDSPREFMEGELTFAFAKRLEKTIQSQPEFWLWSHKRWKRKRPQDAPVLDFDIKMAKAASI
ncbi:lysophospholipid acyltransferase family protein [Aureibacter tunicatorum]|uniref:KDO2-lipid IV(A) lauroyltransferase n=1 Tax=Aureibacter tunicatorum TaxID=866807 RepID=A0AAE3XKC5_9BACT|nr:lysophospholipid acyltransferase family protein [Aureibacter tunicatorum]MDR6238012.1 KDO2-lipid IV(A) lauroyltransferase [Aureibacter tunicatorum]BDD03045.1 lipid A biosynthesis protein [Aureibacter tunicatorum]